VPSVLGLSRVAATAKAAANGLTLRVVSQAAPSPPPPSGAVWKQSLTTGSTVTRATTLTIYVQP
jgi:beta-lactam-binding protein with PASTA domain